MVDHSDPDDYIRSSHHCYPAEPPAEIGSTRRPGSHPLVNLTLSGFLTLDYIQSLRGLEPRRLVGRFDRFGAGVPHTGELGVRG